jgi:hypothetical protein
MFGETMSEPPHFDQFARQTADAVSQLSPNALTVFLAEQLRVMWNARGDADIAKIENGLPDVWTAQNVVSELTRAIRTLDR